MLPYFPTPYPDELWYSVLCRFQIRNGNVMTLFSNENIREIVERIPGGLFSAEDVVIRHTLFPYFRRMYPLEQKRELLRSAGAEAGQKITDRAALHYCPVCCREEEYIYGESYWHREHQLPLMTVCPKHHCRLIVYRKREKRAVPVVPGFIYQREEPSYQVKPYEVSLAKTLYGYLTLHMEKGPTAGYNNLIYGLGKSGYRVTKKIGEYRKGTDKIRDALRDFYGEKLARTFFGSELQGYVPEKILRWELPTPERYVLLAALIGQIPEITFGENLEMVRERERLEEAREIVQMIRYMIAV